MSCTLLYELCSMHLVICNLIYAYYIVLTKYILFSASNLIYLFFCSSFYLFTTSLLFYAFPIIHLILCISSNASHYMHLIYVSHFMHLILCISFYIFHSIQFSLSNSNLNFWTVETRWRQTDRPTDQPTDQPTDRPTDIVTYRAAIAAKNES